MKVSIGAHIVDGPWGGGNRFAILLAKYLEAQGVEVIHHLNDPDIDLILLTEPDPRNVVSAYDYLDVRYYVEFVNYDAIVVHRFNNSSEARDDDERKYNKFRVMANQHAADYSIFVSQWLVDVYQQSGFNRDGYTVILNGGDHSEPIPNEMPEKFKLVTHHWSIHPNKGHEIYLQIDALLNQPAWRDRFEFTFIGRLPDDVQFENVMHIEPMHGEPLMNELRQHNLYVTASKHEANGWHHIEACVLQIPILYRDSGGIPEYCAGFGEKFTDETLVEKLTLMLDNYSQYRAVMPNYPNTDQSMGRQYHDLFQALLRDKDRLIAERTWRAGTKIEQAVYLFQQSLIPLREKVQWWRRRFWVWRQQRFGKN